MFTGHDNYHSKEPPCTLVQTSGRLEVFRFELFYSIQTVKDMMIQCLPQTNAMNIRKWLSQPISQNSKNFVFSNFIENEVLVTFKIYKPKLLIYQTLQSKTTVRTKPNQSPASQSLPRAPACISFIIGKLYFHKFDNIQF